MSKTVQTDCLPAVTIFLGSFLLFMIQPMLGRTLLPVFGGSAAVWGVCLAAYQLLLLAGYGYAHGLARRPFPRQRGVHRTLLSLAVVWTCLTAALGGRLTAFFGGSSLPWLEVLFCVLALGGVPYVLLAAGSTLVQSWLSGGASLSAAEGVDAPRDVYRLYAVSNAGSLLGLMVYPFALEPFVPLTAQWWIFSAALGGYLLLLSVWGGRLVVSDAPLPGPAPSVSESSAEARRMSSPALWLLLPGASAFLLNAVIAHLFTDVTPMPLVWVLMLAVFLLSYIAGFSAAGEKRGGLWCAGAAIALAGAAVANGMWGTGSFYPNAAADVALIFFAGVVLHGWLYAERPERSRLTRYYLGIAAGGACGGLLASLVAPLVFSRVTEYPLALLACTALVAWRCPKPAWLGGVPARNGVFAACVCVLWLGFSWALERHTSSRTMFSGRNFYGCLRVTETQESFGGERVWPVHYLWCGQTTHGLQVQAPQWKRRGTSYYGDTGGGVAFHADPKYRAGEPVKVGVVGLGAGCLATYGRPGDVFRFYEINPQMVRVATDPHLFSFLPDAPMRIDLVPGDARKMLEKERAAGDPLYDILIVDAYNGDAVPYHLATVEAFKLYFDRLVPDGLLAVHVSNWHIDLLPLCKAVAKKLGVIPYGVVGVSENSVTTGAIWVYMTRQPREYRYPGKSQVREVLWENVADRQAPTDERGSLLPLLRL